MPLLQAGDFKHPCGCGGKREVGGGWALGKMVGKEDGGGAGHQREGHWVGRVCEVFS
jgi:hypothetical protein